MSKEIIEDEHVEADDASEIEVIGHEARCFADDRCRGPDGIRRAQPMVGPELRRPIGNGQGRRNPLQMP